MTHASAPVPLVAEFQPLAPGVRAIDRLTGDAPSGSEKLWGIPVGADVYRLRSIPAAVDLNLDDLVLAYVGEDGARYVEDLIASCGHRTLRLIVHGDRADPAHQALLRDMGELGVAYERAAGRFYAVDLPPGLASGAFTRLATDLAARGSAEIETGARLEPSPAAIRRRLLDIFSARDGPPTNNVHPHAAWWHLVDGLGYVDLSDSDMPGRWEELAVRRIEPSSCQVCCVPFFAYDIALGDVVTVQTSPAGFGLCGPALQKSGHWTFRVSLGETHSDEHSLAIERLCAAMERLGCAVEWRTREYLAVDAPTNAAADELADYLWEEMEAGALTYEAGQDAG